MTPVQQVALWLVPETPWRERLDTVISKLAHRFDTVAFEPHITLGVGALSDPSRATRLAAIAAAHPKIALICGGTAHSREHFKTLFVTFDDSPLNELQNTCVDTVGLRGDYEFRPHLSLLYRGSLGLRARQQLAATYRFEGERVAFDEIVLVRPHTPHGDLADIARLDTRERYRLAS